MRSRIALAAFLCAALGTGTPGVALAGAGNDGVGSAVAAPLISACANPSVPAEILDGPPTDRAGALAIVDAGIAQTTLRLAVADDIEKRERGLMCVRALRPQHGMLFVFPESAELDFWMKNTLIPLDMIWLDADGTVTAVAAQVPASALTTPESRIARRRGRGRLVIELRGGEATLDRIAVGTRVVLPPLRAAR